MENSDQIFVVPEDFKAALEKFKALIDEFDLLYKKIVSSNTNLAAAWEGDAASKFREQATIIENIFSKNEESLKTILESRLQYALDNIVEQDLMIANLIHGNPLAQSPNQYAGNSTTINVNTGEVKKNELQFVQGH